MSAADLLDAALDGSPIEQAAIRVVDAELELQAADAAWNQLRIADSTRRFEKARQERDAAWAHLIATVGADR